MKIRVEYCSHLHVEGKQMNVRLQSGRKSDKWFCPNICVFKNYWQNVCKFNILFKIREVRCEKHSIPFSQHNSTHRDQEKKTQLDEITLL